MSIWTRPLFGRVPPRIPASAVAVRCARIREATWTPVFVAAACGYIVSWIVLALGLMVAPAAFGPLPAGVSRAAAMGTSVNALRDSAGGLVSLVVLLPLLVWSIPPAGRWLFDRRAGSMTTDLPRKGNRARRRGARVVGAIVLGVVMVLLVLGLLFDWQPAAGAAAFESTKIGGALLAIGLFGRRGARLVCARCDYPMVTWRGAPEQCPECGNPWRQPWRARFGRRAVRWGWVGAGLGLWALSGVLLTALVRWGL